MRDGIDPISLTVLWNALISTADEMGGALRRTAFSEAVREGEDFSAGLFDRDGRLIAQGNFTPGHMGAMPYVVRNMLMHIPPEQLEPGDTIVTNDSALGGGHLPDFYMVTPVFDGSERIGYVAATAHHVDVGGASPGSQAVQGVAQTYQEGIRVLPVKLIRGGEFDEQLMRVILGNVRMPEKMRGDLWAQRNANFVGAKRFLALYRSHGGDRMRALIEAILDRSEARTRELISAMPDGVYNFDDHLDDVGPRTEPVRVAVDVRIAGSEAEVDFGRSSGEVKAGINCYINYTRAYAMFTMRIFARLDVPHNEGVERAIRVKAPEGSFFNARYPAASGGRATVQVRIFDAVNGALAKAVPGLAMGAFSHWANPNFGGIDPHTGKRWVMYDLIFGGFGGRDDQDGPEGLCPVFNCANVPVEVHESINPVLIHRLEFLADSGGIGRHRGGCGIVKEVEVLADDTIATLLGDRHVFAPYGLFGGGEGGLARTELVRDGRTEQLGSKEVRQLRKGDVLRFCTAGAGGYGAPAERSAEAVAADVRNGFVSAEAAARAYPQARAR